MKKKMLAIVLAALLCCGVFAGCDNGAAPTPKEIIFSAVAPISIKLNQADANLLAGVTATQGDKSVTVTVDKSKVDFTKPGEYEITYTAGDVKKANKVFVYAMPKFFYKDAEIVEKSVNISYKDATLNNKFKKHITAKDSFNVALEVTITEIDTFEGEYGTYKAKYKAEDKAGNVADNEVAYAVLTDGAPIIANTNCDLFVDLVGGDIGIDIDLDGAEELDVFNGTTELSDSDGGDYEYNTVTNKLHFAAAYVKGLGVGTHTLTVKTVNGYTNFNLVVTDNYPTYSTVKKPSNGTAVLDVYKTTAGTNLEAGETVLKYEANTASAFNNRIEIGGAAGTNYNPLNCKTISFDFYAATSDMENPLFYDFSTGANVSKNYDILAENFVGTAEMVKEKWYNIRIDMPTYWSRPGVTNGTLIMTPDSNAQLTAYIKNIKYDVITDATSLLIPNNAKTTIANKTLENGVGEFPELKEVYELTFTGAVGNEADNAFWVASIIDSNYDLKACEKIIFDLYLVGATTDTKYIYAGPGSDKAGSRIDKKTNAVIAGTGDMKGGTWYTFTVDLGLFTTNKNTYLTTAGTATSIYIANLQYILKTAQA